MDLTSISGLNRKKINAVRPFFHIFKRITILATVSINILSALFSGKIIELEFGREIFLFKGQ